MRGNLICSVLSVCALSLSAAVGEAQIIDQHLGAVDPTTESWHANLITTPTGPVTNDLGTGMDAWSIGINGPESGVFYFGTNNTGISAALTNGWNFTMNLRFPVIPSGGFFLFGVNIPQFFRPDGTFGTSGYAVTFQSDSHGNLAYDFTSSFVGGAPSPIFSGPLIQLPNPAVYHSFQIDYHSGTQSADLLVDGVTMVSNFAGAAGSSNTIEWGIEAPASTGLVQGQANVNLVQFTVVPEPSTLTLLALGVGGLVVMQRRR
jgi:PEP-CTERM motif